MMSGAIFTVIGVVLLYLSVRYVICVGPAATTVEQKKALFK